MELKFILITVPIRPEPTNFPPVGATSLLDTLIKTGYRPEFYDIDALRPSFEEVIDFFRMRQPDILGISAVVSTAYKYVKDLSFAVKKVSPKTKIILGGCLAASAEILLRRCPIDVCVIGEGEKILINLIKQWGRFHDFDFSRKEFHDIRGIAFIDPKNDFVFTGYEKQLLPEELSQPNYELLSRYSDIDRFIYDPLTSAPFACDSRSYQPHRRGQRCCYVMTGKGCISRCTFCHRWVKGYRSYPLDNVIGTIKDLKEKYNVGFFFIGDESFGANPNILSNFIEAVEPLDILFRIGGIRISTAHRNPGIVRKLRDAGCVEMDFGIESGSDKILAIMEKGVACKQNIEVAKFLVNEGMAAPLQLVIGMPGENDKTIAQTIECAKAATEGMHNYPRISATFFQALPGTPGYEFMRQRGLIGSTLEDEEAYLLKISDTDAGSFRHYKSVSEEPLSKVFLWRYRIKTEVFIHWYRRRQWRPLKKSMETGSYGRNCINQNALKNNRFLFFVVSLLDKPFWSVMLFMIRIRLYGPVKAILFTSGLRREEDRSAFIIKEPKSLREIVTCPDPKDLSVSEANMIPLRMGR